MGIVVTDLLLLPTCYLPHYCQVLPDGALLQLVFASVKSPVREMSNYSNLKKIFKFIYLQPCWVFIAAQHVESSWIQDQTHVPALAGKFLTTELTRKPSNSKFLLLTWNISFHMRASI